MGNQHEIRQISPTHRLGAAIEILDGYESIVLNLIKPHPPGRFYTYFAPPNQNGKIVNLDGGVTELGILRNSTLIFQSGGKMRCGYDSFRVHIEEIATYVKDSTFLVGDENDFIDEYKIVGNSLNYRRVHSGFWLPIDDYLQNRHPEISPLEDI